MDAKRQFDALEGITELREEDLRKWITKFAKEAGKLRVAKGAATIAQRLLAIGCETVDDLRAISCEILEAECYMLKMDAVRFFCENKIF